MLSSNLTGGLLAAPSSPLTSVRDDGVTVFLGRLVNSDTDPATEESVRVVVETEVLAEGMKSGDTVTVSAAYTSMRSGFETPIESSI